MKCEQVEPEIEAYILGALGTEELNGINEHLKSCAKCRAAVEKYNATMENLALEAGAEMNWLEPPAGHTERFRAKLSQRPQLRPTAENSDDLREANRVRRPAPPPTPPVRRRWNWGWALRPVAAFLLLTVLAMGVWLVNLQNELSQQQAQYQSLATRVAQRDLDVDTIRQLNNQLVKDGQALTTQIATLTNESDGLQRQINAVTNERDGLRQQINTVANERDGLRQQISQLNGANERANLAQSISLLLTRPGATTRSATDKQVVLTVLMVPDERTVALIAQSWPSLPEGQEYRVWLNHTTGKLISAGSVKLLPLSNQSLAQAIINVPEPMSNYTTLWITIEKPDAQAPTGPEIIRDKLA